MVAVRRSGPEQGEIRLDPPSHDGVRPTAVAERTQGLIEPEAPRTSTIQTGGTSARVRAPASTGGFLEVVSGFFGRHRPAVAAAMAGVLLLPPIGVGAAPRSALDAGLNRAAIVETIDRASPHTLYVAASNRPARIIHQEANPFAAIQDASARFELLMIKAGALEDGAANMSAEQLADARSKLFAQYREGAGAIGVEPNIPVNQTTAYKIAFAQPTRDISARNVTEFALFKYFWETEGQDGLGLARHGLDEVTPEGVVKLIAWARTHDVDGKEKKATLQRLDPDQRAVMRAIIDHSRYGQYFEVDARPPLYKAFSIDAASVKIAPGNLRPTKAGDIEIAGVTDRASRLRYASLTTLPDLMRQEYQERRAFFEDQAISVETRGLRALGLLKDYADAMWSRGEKPETENTGYKLLEEFMKLPYAAVHGTKDFNGAGFNVAQSLVLGLDPNKLETRFPDATLEAPNTYFSMNGEMAKAMGFVDLWLEAHGRPKGAEAYEKKSPLGWMLGQEVGHTKAGNLNEKKPFSSSGLNWGLLLFPNDDEVRNLPPKADFEFAIDCIDGFNNAVTARAEWGDRLEVRGADGAPLTVEKKIETDAEGKAKSWYAVFKDADGHEVDPSKVLGVILNASGEIKGDGKATREINMWWWGFCDRNTAQRLYKSMYGVPQLDRDVRLAVDGKEIVIPKDEAQKIIDMDIPDLVPRETMSGFRFNEEPQVVKLKNGRTIEARVRDIALDAGPGVERVSGDLVAIHDAPGRPMLGTIELRENGSSEEGRPFGVDVRYVKTITKNDDGTVIIKMNDEYDGYRTQVTGKLLTDVKWEKATVVDGKTVLEQNEQDWPIRGGFTLELLDGTTKRVSASDVSQITGETQHDLRISQFTKWVMEMKGIFATDGDPGVVVSNGARVVNHVEITQFFDDTRPDWAPTKKLAGIHGYLKREEGDKMVWLRALYGAKGTEPSTALYAGWIQVSKECLILNEAFTQGQPDFGWAGNGSLNWSARSSFNPYMDPELRLRIFVNGVSDAEKLDKLMNAGNLPENWRSYLEAQPAPTPPATTVEAGSSP
jgi:hypothetical protein